MVGAAPNLLRSEIICTFAYAGRWLPAVVYFSLINKCDFIMSKGSLFWGNASGKLGESVFYRAKGEQRNRTYVKNIANPRTEAQAVNRISMANFSAVFRVYKDLLRVSFPNKANNQSGFNAFVKENKTATSPALPKSGLEAGLFVARDMVLSKGSISHPSALKVRPITAEDATDACLGYMFPVLDFQGNPAFDALFAEVGEGANHVVLQDATMLGHAFDLMGLPQDAVITIPYALYADEGYEGGIIKVTREGVVSDTELVQFCMCFDYQDGTAPAPSAIYIGAFATGYTDEVMCALIISHKVEDKVQVTTSRMLPMGSNLELSNQFYPNGDLYAEVLAEYAPSAESILV